MPRTVTKLKTVTKLMLVCVDNAEYPAALEKRKIYIGLPDEGAEARGYVRVIDESGEDYLYPMSIFCEIALPKAVKDAVLAAA